ncbi:protein sisterless A [Drosophila tropicalis]|uniref:protein sisterless A n=1 Tax=Drosophila tropicalis TaxID=46794 RepID=UPI0035ABB828
MEQSANLYLPNFYTQLASGSTFADHGTEKTMPHHRYYQQQHHHHLHHHLQQQQHTQQHDKPEQIDQLVALELQHLKTHYADEEQRYVDQMLIENPVVVERRSPAVVIPSGTSIPTAQKSRSHGSRDDAQRQRAESCRKSRYNNKIKKAKLRFRHKFVCSQLNESAGVLDYMREVIAQAETQLLARGFNRVALERMRQTFGVNQCNGSAAIMDQ